jgi:hypothetical protein
MTAAELKPILGAHAAWLRGEPDGKRADLTWANLAGASLTEANLAGASLTGANLAWANLTGANLAGANLTEAYLAGANLAGTFLDPASTPNADWPAEADAEGYVTGYRSRRFGALCGTSPRDLKDGETVRAEVFSAATTECHPGLYLWPTLDMARKWAYGHIKCGAPIVSVRVRKADIHRAGDKWRAKEIIVVGEAS